MNAFDHKPNTVPSTAPINVKAIKPMDSIFGLEKDMHSYHNMTGLVVE